MGSVNLPGGVFPSTQCQTGHLGTNTDTTLIQQANGVLVTLAFLTEKVTLGNDDIVKVEHAGAASADTQLLLLLGNGETRGILLDHEGRDALVALAGIQVRKDNKHPSLHGVGDPHLGPIDLVPIRRLFRLSLQGEGIGSRRRLRETERPDSPSSELRQPRLLERGVGPLVKRRVDKRVVHIHQDTNAGVDAGQFLDGHDGRGKVHAGSAVLLGDLDAHQPLLEQLLDQCGVHDFGLVHFPHFGPDLLLRELGDGFGHQGLGFGEMRDWGRG
jgi:hypothetical protein